MSQVETLRRWRDRAYDSVNYAEALLVADKILIMTKETGDALALGKILYNKQQYLRAADILKDPTYLEDLNCRTLAVRCLIKCEKYDAALELVQTNLNSATLMCLGGDIWSAKNLLIEAKGAYIEALRLDSTCYEAFDNLIRNHLLTQTEQRDLILRLEFDQMGNCVDIFKSLYQIRLVESPANVDLADEGLDHLTDIYDLGDNSDILAARVDLLQSQGKYQECQALCEQILEKDPHHYAIYGSYITALYERDDTNQLFKVGHKLAEESPDLAITWVAIGAYYMVIANTVEARRHFSKATMLDPLCMPAWVGFAHTFANEREHERAITAYSTAARLFPGSHQPYLFLAMQHLQLNNLDLAEEYLKMAGDMCSMSDPLLLNEMAVICYHRNNLSTALDYVLRALDLSAKQGCDSKTLNSIKSNHGHILRRLNRDEESLVVFEEIARSTPDDCNTWISLGLVHLNLGNRDTAITYFSDALSVQRNDKIATELLNRAMKNPKSIDDIVAELNK